MVCVLRDDDQFVWISRVLYSQWKLAGKVVVSDTSSDHRVLCLRDVSGVEDDCAYNYDNEEQSAEDEDRLADTEIHVLIPLRSFGKITLGATSRRRWRIHRCGPFLCRHNWVWMLFLDANNLSLLLFYTFLVFCNRFRKLIGCA